MRLTYGLRLPTDSRHVPVVRRLCTATLTELGVTPDAVDEVGLAVSEACANVVQHAGTEEDFEVRVDVTSGTCRIEVVDHGVGVAAASGGGRRLDGRGDEPGDGPPTHGRGFALMALLVDQLDFTLDEGGTTVVLTKQLALLPGSVLEVEGGRSASSRS